MTIITILPFFPFGFKWVSAAPIMKDFKNAQLRIYVK